MNSIGWFKSIKCNIFNINEFTSHYYGVWTIISIHIFEVHNILHGVETWDELNIFI